MRDGKKIVKVLTFITVAGVIIGYAYYRTRDFIVGPQITIHSPQNGMSTTTDVIVLAGTAKNISFISVNDRKIYTDEAGYFKDTLLLYPGYNIITIKAKDRFDRNTQKALQVVYKPPESATPTPNPFTVATSTPENVAQE